MGRYTNPASFTFFLQKATFRRLRSKLGPSFNVDDEEYVANNLLKLNVFYENLILKNIEESPAYPVSQMHHL